MGFSRPYIAKVGALPSWWDDEVASNPAGFAEMVILLSRHLGIEAKSMLDPSAPLRLKDFGACKYKKRAGTSIDELRLSRVIASRAAQLAAAALERPYLPVPAVTDLRQQILENAPWVGLKELLDICWSHGIPVLHVNNFPKDVKKPDGVTMNVAGRPVIVLCREESQPSWLSFILAHELGHIAGGHIADNSTLLDEKVQDNELDPEETEADRFATELLTGNASTGIYTDGRWPNANDLAELAVQFGKRNQVDPGHVVLNYAHTMGPNFFPVARAALKQLFPTADAIDIVRNRAAASLDWEQLPESSSEFLMRITRQESDE